MERVASRTGRPLFSMWAWALLTPLLLTAYGGYDTARDAGERWLGFGVAILTHLALGLAFLAAGAIERRIRRYSTWIAFVALTIAAMSLLRPTLVRSLHDAADIPPVPTEWWVRVVMNALVLSGAIIVVGLWLRASDRNARSQATLRRVLNRRADDIRDAERASDDVVSEFTMSVAGPVLAALEEARVRPFDAAEQAERLRLVAHEVVRPLSHRVFGAASPSSSSAEPPTIAIERVTRRRPSVLPSRVVPAPAWLPVMIVVFTSAPAVFGSYGVGAGSVRLLIAAVVGILLNLLVGLVPLRRGWPAITAFGLGYLAVGVAIAWVLLDRSGLLTPAPAAGTPLEYWFYLTLGYTAIAVFVALAFSLLEDARGTERTLARALEFAEEAAADSRARYAQTANDVARMLHNHVQGDILATSLQLRMGIAGENAVDELIALVARELHEPAETRAVERTAQDVRDAANAAIVSWSRVMDVTSEAADPGCWRWLAQHPAATALFLDANIEALTNAARHAAAPTADLRLERIDGGVRMLVRNPGRLGPNASDGVGVADLRRRGARVELRQETPETVLLTVDIVDTGDDEDATAAREASSRA